MSATNWSGWGCRTRKDAILISDTAWLADPEQLKKQLSINGPGSLPCAVLLPEIISRGGFSAADCLGIY